MNKGKHLRKVFIRITNHLKQIGGISLLTFSLLLLTSVIVLMPLMKAQFYWFDDAWDLMTAKSLINYSSHLNLGGVFSILVENASGRFRPVYWFWQSFMYLFSGNSPEVQYFIHSLLILAIVLIVYQIVYFICKSRLGGFVAGSLLLIVAPNIENWCRLGPQEPFQCFFLIFSLLILFKYKNYFWSIAILLLAFLSKETTIAIVPAVIAIDLLTILKGHRNRDWLKFAISSILFSGVIITVESQIKSGYSTHYTFNILDFVYRFKYYIGITFSSLPFFNLLIVTFLTRSIYQIYRYGIKKIDDKVLMQFFFLIFLISTVLVQSPWTIIADRYLMPTIMAGVIFSGIELGQILAIIKKISEPVFKIGSVIFCLAFVNFLIYGIIGTIAKEVSFVHNTEELQSVLKYVAGNVPEKGNVFINFQDTSVTSEPLEEMNWQLGLLYNRTDLTIKPMSEMTQLTHKYLLIDSSTITPAYWPREEIYTRANFKLGGLIKKDSVQQTDSYFVLGNQATVLRQTFKKILALVITGERFDSVGIYTKFYLKDSWNYYFYN